MKTEINSTHNPNYKLVQTTVFLNGNFLDLVYGETNESLNAGLEIYFKKSKDGNHYRSYRYREGFVPSKYLAYYTYLKHYCNEW